MQAASFPFFDRAFSDQTQKASCRPVSGSLSRITSSKSSDPKATRDGQGALGAVFSGGRYGSIRCSTRGYDNAQLLAADDIFFYTGYPWSDSGSWLTLSRTLPTCMLCGKKETKEGGLSLPERVGYQDYLLIGSRPTRLAERTGLHASVAETCRVLMSEDGEWGISRVGNQASASVVVT